MKGLILIPKIFYNTPTLDRYWHLFFLIQKELGFDIVFADDYDIDKIDVDLVVIFKSPQKKISYVMQNLVNLPKDIKLIAYYTDITGGELYTKNMEKLLVRADKILCSYDYAFKKRWDRYAYKYEFFPHFFATFEYYNSMKFNTLPMLKCLLSGAINKAYPLRMYVDSNINDNLIKLNHPGYEKLATSDKFKLDFDYGNELNKYFCCLATSSIYDYVVAKYFEIPASGSLLLANYTPDLDILGFVDGKNYLAVTKENFFEKLSDVLKNPDKYDQIRHDGRKFVLENFSELNRFDQFKRIVTELVVR